MRFSIAYGPLAAALSLVHISSGAETASSTDDKLFTALIKWIVSNNGHFNPKQEFRLSDPANPKSHKGMFATERIEEGEQLFSVPWDCVISDPDDDYSNTAMVCGTFQIVIDAMKKFLNNEDTFYEPYMAMLNANRLTPWPSGWTSAGKDLLNELLDDSALPPEDVYTWFEDWVEECDGDVEDSTASECVMSFLMRGEDNRLIPLYDLYNHRNGKWFNTETIVKEFEYQAMKASRVIEAGEEIYGSYYMCSNCGDWRQHNYGTPDVLRDYGFVEQFPQRWIFENEGIGFDLDESEEDGSFQVKWLPSYPVNRKGIAFLRLQHERLTKIVLPKLEQVQNGLREPDRSDGIDSTELPLQHEFDVIWDYYKAITFAMEQVIPPDDGTACPGGFERDGECVIVDGYDDLREKQLKYDPVYQATCNNTYVFEYSDYNMTTMNSSYQEINWYVRPTDKDVCLELDNTMQICSCYRPHYHEFMTHLPARYMDTIKRAVFVGGGDSMLLFELLKYPSIELVLGLELDQMVVRNSFKYFQSQPHFDDERVEWWFGDATKSLLLLPKDYFGSFDLVLVDLSETVVAVPVTDSLNIIETLTLLLKPDGIFVKNEIYFPDLSTMFDYTIQVYFQDVPKICDQAYAMGSNRIDFINPDIENLKAHDVPMLLLEPVESDEDRFAYIHNYQKNNALQQGKCGESTETVGEVDETAGILMVLEAENTTMAPLKWETVEPAIQSALEKLGLTPVSSVSRLSSEGNGDTGVVVMREGFVVARLFPVETYCAFDIHLWGGFTKMESVKSSLANAVGSNKTSLSSYRVLVSGMIGASTWSEDKDTIGPVIVNSRNCDEQIESTRTLAAVPRNELAQIALEESLELIQSENVLAVTICGSSEEPCSSLKVLSKNTNIRKVATLGSCPDIEDAQFTEDPTALMFKCETDTLKTLRGIVGEEGKISSLVIDLSTPIEMLKVMSAILDEDKGQLFMEHVVFIGLMMDKTELWRRSFLDRCMVSRDTRYSYRAEVEIKSADGDYELGVVSSDDAKFIAHVKDISVNIASRAGVDAEVRKVVGGRFKSQDNWNPKRFPADDYDQAPGREQYNKQLPLGHQIILRLELDDYLDEDGQLGTLAKEVMSALEKALIESKFTKPDLSTFEEADGIVIVALASEGNVVAVLDGDFRIDINLFTIDSDVADLFQKEFTKRLPEAKVMSREDQPRGIGRVINSMKDIARTE